jgi:hypothetical protein
VSRTGRRYDRGVSEPIPPAIPLDHAAGWPAGPWTLAYDGFDPAGERLREALCTLGNGYFASVTGTDGRPG